MAISKLLSDLYLLCSRIQMEGKVVQRAECAPINGKSYMNIKREAITKAGEPVSTL